MSTHSDVEKFLQAVFGSDYGTHAIFANLCPAAHERDFRKLNTERDSYWSVSAFPPGATSNLGDDAIEVRALVIDDVGTKGPSEGAVRLALGEPTAIVETSSGNFQWGYRLSKPVAVDDWNGFFGGIEALIGHSVPLEARAAQTLMRLPMGINTKGPDAKGKMKLGHGGTFGVRLVKLNTGVRLDPDTIVRAPSKSAGSKTYSGDGWAHDIAGLMALIPNNDVHYDDWFAHAERIVAAAINKEAARPAFEMWSEKSAKHDPAEIEKRWPTVDPTRTAGLELIAEAEAADPEGYKAWLAREADKAFDDGVVPPGPPKTKRKGITATPHQWKDPDTLPLRDWLYGKLLIRKFISMTVAPGGIGKSSLIAVEALAQVTGQALLGVEPPEPLRVWLWNLEDPLEETEKKIQAAALHYGLSEADIGGRLYIDSGRQQNLVIAVMERNAPTVVRPVVADLVAEIKRLKIDVVVVDPFVSCHTVPENDNTAQDMVVKEWGRVAELGGCAVHLVDHTRKAGVGAEVTTESSRGGKAKTDAARVVRVINRMTKDEGEKVFGILEPWRYFHTFNDKANMAPPVDSRDWFHLESVWLGNGGKAAAAFAVGAGTVTGDSVGVVTRWKVPSAEDLSKGENFTAMIKAMAGKRWRMGSKSKDWVGFAAAQALSISAENTASRTVLKKTIDKWIAAKLLKVSPQFDEYRKLQDYIEIVGGY